MTQATTVWNIVFSAIKLRSDTLSVRHNTEVDYRDATEQVIKEMYRAPKRALEFEGYTDQLDVFVRYRDGKRRRLMILHAEDEIRHDHDETENVVLTSSW